MTSATRSSGLNWCDVESALDRVLALPEHEWRSACERLADGDLELLAELRSLIACVGGHDPILDLPLPLAGSGPESSSEPQCLATMDAGIRIGAWRILGLIGRGGMGEVYEASRADGQFEQRAALKLMQREAGAHLQRFQSERQILARLDHPGIAHLLDGGASEDGRPYMVMELVQGESITDYCARTKANLSERLRLMGLVCDAVTYAHRNLIVHRDLKPANVFVIGDGTIKLLDFGVAKLLAPGRDEPTQQAPLTPAYAAPEQLTGDPITTATDVYALGMLLFELLAGQRPWNLADLPLTVGLEKVLSEIPPDMSEVAQTRADPPVPPALLRGDLDAIVAKAIRKDPEHRYESVAALSRDILRSQRAEPVAARNRARLYILGRFARRHRVSLSAGALALLVLIAAGVAILVQANRAEREAQRATRTRDFLISVFSASDPRILADKPRGGTTAKALLDANASRITREFADDPATEVELLGTVAAIYRELGERGRYIDLNGQMLDIARRYYGDRHPVVINALLDEADRANDEQEFAAAQAILLPLNAQIQHSGLDHDRARARWWLEWGMSLAADEARQDERVQALERAAALFARFAPQDPAYVTNLSELGTLQIGQGDIGAAKRYFRQAIDVDARIAHRNDAELGTIYSNLALAQQQSGDFAGADLSYTRTEEIARRTYGEHSRQEWVPEAQHARMLHLSGERTRAMSLFAAVMPFLPPPDTPDHEAAVVRENYGGCLAAEGRPLAAIPLLETALRAYQVNSERFFDSVRARLLLGNAYDLVGRGEDARRTLKSVLEDRIRVGPPDFQALLAARERWGRFLLTHGDANGARDQFLAILAQAHGRRLSHIALAQGGLARLALEEGDSAAAVEGARRAVDDFEHVEGFRDVRMGPYLWDIYARTLLAKGDVRGAASWAGRAVEALRRYDDPSSAELANAKASLRSIQERSTH